MVQASGDSGDRPMTMRQRIERLRAAQALSEIQERSSAYAEWKANAEAAVAAVEARRVAMAGEAKMIVDAELREAWDKQMALAEVLRAENLERYGADRMAERIERHRVERINEDRRQRYEREVRLERRRIVANAGYTTFYAIRGQEVGSFWQENPGPEDAARIELWNQIGQTVVFYRQPGAVWDSWTAHPGSVSYPDVRSAHHPAFSAALSAMMDEYHFQTERLKAAGVLRQHSKGAARNMSR